MMCTSRLRLVVEAGERTVAVEDGLGGHEVVSLLALEGPVPAPGEWLVVHSGYALARADAAEAAAAVATLRAARTASRTRR